MRNKKYYNPDWGLLDKWENKESIDFLSYTTFMKLLRLAEDRGFQMGQNGMLFHLGAAHVSKAYKEVLKHRSTCPKWENQELCIDCFGGGLVKFTRTLADEFLVETPFCYRDWVLQEKTNEFEGEEDKI